MLGFGVSGVPGGPLLLPFCTDAVTMASTLASKFAVASTSVSKFAFLAVIPNARTLFSAKKCSSVTSASLSHRPLALDLLHGGLARGGRYVAGRGAPKRLVPARYFSEKTP